MDEGRIGYNSQREAEQPDNIFQFLNLSIESGRELHPNDLHEALAHKEITQEEHDKLIDKLIENSQGSLVDSLTGISNRQALDKELVGAMKRLNKPYQSGEERRSRIDYVLFFIIDLNQFKSLNDVHGHHIGDEALKLVATFLEEEAIERKGTAARYGGDEFALLQESVGDLTEEGVQEISLRLQEKINTRLSIPIDGKDLKFTISVGGAIVRKGETKNIDQLKEEADKKMYENKKESR